MLSTDISETHNRIRLGVRDLSAEPRLRSLVSELKIPQEMVIVFKDTPAVILSGSSPQ